jgi:hypothetical protein
LSARLHSQATTEFWFGDHPANGFFQRRALNDRAMVFGNSLPGRKHHYLIALPLQLGYSVRQARDDAVDLR